MQTAQRGISCPSNLLLFFDAHSARNKYNGQNAGVHFPSAAPARLRWLEMSHSAGGENFGSGSFRNGIVVIEAIVYDAGNNELAAISKLLWHCCGAAEPHGQFHWGGRPRLYLRWPRHIGQNLGWRFPHSGCKETVKAIHEADVSRKRLPSFQSLALRSLPARGEADSSAAQRLAARIKKGRRSVLFCFGARR